MFFVSLFLEFEGRFIISREVGSNGEKSTFYEKMALLRVTRVPRSFFSSQCKNVSKCKCYAIFMRYGMRLRGCP